MWMIENPERGVQVPDDLPHDYVLKIAKPYLGQVHLQAFRLDAAQGRHRRLRRLRPAQARSQGPLAVQELSRSRTATNSVVQGRARTPFRAGFVVTLAAWNGVHRTDARLHDLQIPPPETRPRTRHAAVRHRPRRTAEELPHVQEAPAARAGVLRGQGQPRPGHRAHAVQGRAPASTWPRCRSSTSSTRTSRTCRPRSGRTGSGTRSSTPIRSRPIETLEELNQYKPLVTFDNLEEIHKIKQVCAQRGPGAAPQGAQHRRDGRAVLEVRRAPRRGGGPDSRSRHGSGSTVEGISFHVGSQTTNFENYVQALNLAANVFQEAKDRGYTKMNLLDIGGGFPAPYDATVKPFPELAEVINAELDAPVPEGHPDPRRARPVPGRDRGLRRVEDHRQGRARREDDATTSTTASTTPTPA